MSRPGHGKGDVKSRRLFVIVLLIAGMAALVAHRASEPMAMEHGTAEELWELATGLPYARGSGGSGGVLPASGSRFAYFSRRGRGYGVYGVRSHDVVRMLPRVMQDLHVGHRVRALRPSVAAGYARWAVSTSARERGDSVATAASLVRYLFEAEVAASLEDFPSAASDLQHRARDARERWIRADRVTTTAAVEIVFLAAWMMFVAWPWLRGAPARRWALHVALAPVLLYVPHALGYAPSVFHARPSGGLVYPALMMLLIPALLFPRTTLDAALRHAMPDLLEPLNQVPSAPDRWISPSAALGPMGVLLYGAVLGFIVYLLRRRVELDAPRTPGDPH